jgi:hypothetical protein
VTLTVNHVVSLSPSLEILLMGLFDDIKGQIEELKAAAATEHDQVLAALAALEAKIGESLTLDEKLQLGTLFAEAKSAIGGIYEPPTPTE